MPLRYAGAAADSMTQSVPPVRAESNAPRKDRLGVPSNPPRQAVFIERPRRKREHRLDGVHRIGAQALAIQRQEQTNAQKRRALVAIDESMVLRDPEGVGRRQRGRISGLVV